MTPFATGTMSALLLILTGNNFISHRNHAFFISASDMENRLTNLLFEAEGYNPLIRPVKNISEVIQVNVTFTIVQLLHVDEKSQLMKTNIWITLDWVDAELEWNPDEYDGIKDLRVLPHKVWMPEVVLINNADGKFKVSFEPNVIVRYDGKIKWLPPSIYKSSCKVDMTFFPFDNQECEMKFASWTYNAAEVELIFAGVDRESVYGNSTSWDLEEVRYNSSTEYDANIDNYISTLTFTLHLRRKALFYTVNLLIPCILISTFGSWVFYLPANFLTKKITMCVCILLALVFFLTLLYKLTPPSTTIPLITKYLLFTFIMHVIAIMSSVIILNWNFRTPRTHRMPMWVRSVFLNYLPRLLFMTRPSPEEQSQLSRRPPLFSQPSSDSRQQLSDCKQFTGVSSHIAKSNTSTFLISSSVDSDGPCRESRASTPTCVRSATTSERLNVSCNTVNMVHLHSDTISFPSSNHNNMVSSCNHSHSAQQPLKTSPELNKAIEAIRFVAAHLKNDDDYEEVLNDWHYISLVFDRLHLVAFVIVTIAGLLGLLVYRPS